MATFALGTVVSSVFARLTDLPDVGPDGSVCVCVCVCVCMCVCARACVYIQETCKTIISILVISFYLSHLGSTHKQSIASLEFKA